jgi:hypothetical protein
MSISWRASSFFEHFGSLGSGNAGAVVDDLQWCT